jgi:hypothetical protein
MKNNKQQFTIVLVDDVKQYGLIRATILGKIKGWCETNHKGKRYHYDGFYWSGHITLNQMVEQTGLPLETVKKNLKWLIDNNVVIKGNYNKIKIDRTGWYRHNPTVLLDPIQSSCEEHTIVPVRNNGTVLSGIMDNTCEEQTIPTIPSNIPSNIKKPTITTTIPTTNPSVEDLLIELKDLNYLIEKDIFLTPDDRGAAFVDRNRVEKQIKQLVINKK